jgi:hypothetical protein
MGRFGVFLLPLLLCGCLTAKGKLLPAENASTPLAAGKYYRIDPGDRAADFDIYLPASLAARTMVIFGSLFLAVLVLSGLIWSKNDR